MVEPDQELASDLLFQAGFMIGTISKLKEEIKRLRDIDDQVSAIIT